MEGTRDTRGLLTVPQAARLCNVSVSRMYHIVAARELPVYKIGSSVRIMPADLDRYVSSRRVYSRNEILRIAAGGRGADISHLITDNKTY